MNKIELTTEWLEANLGRALTEKEQSCINWINGWEMETVQTIAGLIEQAHSFGYISGQKTKK